MTAIINIFSGNKHAIQHTVLTDWMDDGLIEEPACHCCFNKPVCWQALRLFTFEIGEEVGREDKETILINLPHEVRNGTWCRFSYGCLDSGSLGSLVWIAHAWYGWYGWYGCPGSPCSLGWIAHAWYGLMIFIENLG